MIVKCVVYAALVALLAASANAQALPLNSFTSPFNPTGGRTAIPNWEYGGDATLNRDAVALTPPFEGKYGFVYNKSPVKELHWSVDIKFSIAGTAEITDSEGMTFWYVQSPEMVIGNTNGTRPTFIGIGVFFDTFDDHLQINNSFVWTMTNDGTKEYGHQHAEYDDEDEPAACIMDFRNRPAVVARIAYVDRVLSVQLDLESKGQFSSCFEIHDIDLPPGLHYGMSGTTGRFEDSFSVASFQASKKNGGTRDAKAAPGHNLHGAIEPPHISSQASTEEVTKPLEVEIDMLKEEVSRLSKDLSAQQHENLILSKDLAEEKRRRDHLEKTAALRAEVDKDVAAGGTGEGAHPIIDQLESLLASHLEKDFEHQKASMDAYERVFRYEDELDKRRREFQDEASRSLSHLHAELKDVHVLLNSLASRLGTGEIGTSGGGEGVSVHMKSLEDKLMSKLLKHTEHLNILHESVTNIKDTKALPPMGPQLEQISKQFTDLRAHVERSKDEQKALSEALHASNRQITEAIETHGRIGFWTYFLFIQVAFAFGYIFYTKYREEKKTHLF